MTRSVAGCDGQGDGGNMNGGEELRPSMGMELRSAKTRGEEGFGRGAHGEAFGDLSALGDGLETTACRWRSPAADDEDDGGDGSTGRPTMRGLTKRTRTTT